MPEKDRVRRTGQRCAFGVRTERADSESRSPSEDGRRQLSEPEGNRGVIAKAAVPPLAGQTTTAVYLFSISNNRRRRKPLTFLKVWGWRLDKASGTEAMPAAGRKLPELRERLLSEAPQNPPRRIVGTDGRRRRAMTSKYEPAMWASLASIIP